MNIIDALTATGDLSDYQLLHAARADLLRRNGSREEAAKSYLRALALVTNDRERGYLERRLREVSLRNRELPTGAPAATPAMAGNIPKGSRILSL